MGAFTLPALCSGLSALFYSLLISPPYGAEFWYTKLDKLDPPGHFPNMELSISIFQDPHIYVGKAIKPANPVCRTRMNPKMCCIATGKGRALGPNSLYYPPSLPHPSPHILAGIQLTQRCITYRKRHNTSLTFHFTVPNLISALYMLKQLGHNKRPHT